MRDNTCKNICMGCMCENTVKNGICINCNFDEEAYTKQYQVEIEDEFHHKSKHSRVLPLGFLLGGKYLIGRVLGQGGFGITYIALDCSLECKVAIKELFSKNENERQKDGTVTIKQSPPNIYTLKDFENDKEQFLNEAKTLAKFNSNYGIVSVKEYFKDNNTAYIAMEYLEGNSLGNLIEKQKKESVDKKWRSEKILGLFKQVIMSMGELHKEGILHCDISPDNIIVTPKKQVKLIDFGTTKLIQDGEMGAEFCKRYYSPPEQQQGKKVGKYSDVYALCATIYYALTNVKPQNSTQRMEKDELQPIQELVQDITPIEAMVIMNGLKLDSSERIASAAELFYFLYSYQKEETASVDKLNVMLHAKEIRKKVQSEVKVKKYNKHTNAILGIIGGIIFLLSLIYLYKVAITTKHIGADSSNYVVSQKVITDNDNTENSKEESSEDSMTAKKESASEKVSKFNDELTEDMEKQLNQYRDSLGFTSYTREKQLDLIAKELADSLMNADSSVNLSNYCEELIENIKIKYNISQIAWMGVKENTLASSEKTLKDMLKNENNVISINSSEYVQCGIGISEENNAKIFWIVLFG